MWISFRFCNDGISGDVWVFCICDFYKKVKIISTLKSKIQRPVIIGTPWDGLRFRLIMEMKIAAAISVSKRPVSLADLRINNIRDRSSVV